MRNSHNSLFLTFVTCIIGILFSFVISYAYADGLGENAEAIDKVTETLCMVTNALGGPVGKTIAILIVMTVAISLFLGKITWGVAITIAVGMGLLFGSTQLVTLISGGENPCEQTKKP